jgi:hypothetical protein
MKGFRLLDIVVIILLRIKGFIQVSRRGRSRVTLLTTGVVVASSHDEGKGGWQLGQVAVWAWVTGGWG